MTAADVLIEALIDWGVEVVFGLPGDGINGIMESLRTRQDKVRFIPVRHEESAALMACGYAKFTGKLGVCLATSGPGGIHLLNGLYDAKLDGQPVLAITGLQFHDLIGTYTQQDVALDKLFMMSPFSTSASWAQRMWKMSRIWPAGWLCRTTVFRTSRFRLICRRRKSSSGSTRSATFHITLLMCVLVALASLTRSI
jgi:thiamine pyrophosphate-dependent acetolactate synthase large subunit-like protein